MLAVESVLDVAVDVNLVDDLVCVVLQSSCEDDDLVELGHQLYEVYAPWSHQEVRVLSILYIRLLTEFS